MEERNWRSLAKQKRRLPLLLAVRIPSANEDTNRHSRRNNTNNKGYFCHPQWCEKNAMLIGFLCGVLIMLILLIFDPGNGEGPPKELGWHSVTRTCTMNLPPEEAQDNTNLTSSSSSSFCGRREAASFICCERNAPSIAKAEGSLRIKS